MKKLKIVTIVAVLFAMASAFASKSNNSANVFATFHQKAGGTGTCSSTSCIPSASIACSTAFVYYNDDGSGGCGTTVSLFHN